MAAAQEKALDNAAGSLRDDASHSFLTRNSDEADITPIIRRTAKRLAGGLRMALQPLTSEKLNVTAEPPRTELQTDWLEAQGASMGLAFFQLPPMKGRAALRLPHDFIAALVDAFFGGSIGRSKSKKNSYSSTDMRLMHRIASAIGPQLGAAWAETGPFRCLAAGLTDDPDEIRPNGVNTAFVIQPFTLSYAGDTSFSIEIVYPVEMIKSAREEWSVVPDVATIPLDPQWHEDLGVALSEVYLPVRSVLARPTMTLPELANLKPGDIIPIPPARNLPLIVGDRPFARGSLGEQNGLAAFRIDYIEKGSIHE